MNQYTTPQLLTCRYWALGPFCPNIDENGITQCGFAHWDTGRLASTFMQRGTCGLWVQNRCRYGQTCWFEHRHTGVPALNQGVLRLTGIHLEIANAAYASNFDTCNHEALMNLIWSVKRVILRHNHPAGGAPPPKDPIYPDRYRPGGMGDNTKRHRNIPATSSPPPMHTVRPLGSRNKQKRRYRKRNNKDTAKSIYVGMHGLHKVLNNARITKPYTNTGKFGARPTKQNRGTKQDPINLLDNNEDEKDRYGSTSGSRSTKIERSFPGTGMVKHSVNIPPETADDDILPQVESLLNTFPIYRTNTIAEMAIVLQAVDNNLKIAQTSMKQSQLTMQALFAKNSARLGEDSIFAIMSNLSREIYRAYDGAKDGALEIDRSMQWLRADNDQKLKDEKVLKMSLRTKLL